MNWFEEKNTRTLDFDLERPVDKGSSTLSSEVVSVQAPLLGLVPIPALLIETIDINFGMEVSSHSQSKESTNAEVTASYNGGFGCLVEVSGKVLTSRENTRSMDNTAKYEVRVAARQQALEADKSDPGCDESFDLFFKAAQKNMLMPNICWAY